SVLFKLLVLLSQVSGLTPEVPVTDRVAVGVIHYVNLDMHGKIQRVVIKLEIGEAERELAEVIGEELEEEKVIDTADSLLDVLSSTPGNGEAVIVSTYEIRNRVHYLIRKADQPLGKIYDTGNLPRYLFIGAALMTVGILVLLLRKL